MVMRFARLQAVVVALLAGAGCASVPEGIEDPGRDSPDLATVRGAPEAHQGETVRWGGTIAAVDNREDETLIAVVARDLQRHGQPREGDTTPGRFLARIDGFLDPAIYRTGRPITVRGTVDGTRKRAVGDYEYDHVVVATTGHHLWPQPTARERDDLHTRHDAFFYSPYGPRYRGLHGHPRYRLHYGVHGPWY